MRGRTHRSFVSYIDQSREFYAAKGYDRPYQWAHHREAPFTALSRPLRDCRVGVGTTADLGPRAAGHENRLFAAPLAATTRLTTEVFWDRDATHTDDTGSYLPLAALQRAADAERIASLSPRFYGIATDYSQRRTTDQDAPQIAAWMREDGVDVAVVAAL